MSFAKAVLSGTVMSDPEKRFTPNNHGVTSFNLQVENSGKPGSNEPFTVRVTCWRNLADAVVEQLKKGDSILVEGKLQMNSFQGQDGTQKKLFEVEANTVDKLPGQPEAIVPAGGEGQSSGGGFNGSSQAARNNGGDGFDRSNVQVEAPSAGHFSSEDLLTEDDIPF